MKRKFRILKIRFRGRYRTLKIIHKKIVFERLLAYAKTKNKAWEGLSPKEFEKAMNLAAIGYLSKKLNS